MVDTRTVEISFDCANNPAGSPLPNKAKLHFSAMTVKEELSKLFKIDLEFYSSDLLDHDLVLGCCLTVKVNITDPRGSGVRYFNGHIVNFSHQGKDNNNYRYKAVLRPWLWFLTRRRDSRIAESKRLSDILEGIFGEYQDILSGYMDGALTTKFSSIDLADTDYRVREYCVQYRETDFDFVNRIMEQEGVYYYFTHGPKEHILVLVDNKSCHQFIVGPSQIKLLAGTDGGTSAADSVYDWQATRTIQSGKFSRQDFWFKEPSEGTITKTKTHTDSLRAKLTEFEYPGEFCKIQPGTYDSVGVGTARTGVQASHLKDDADDLAQQDLDAKSVLAKFSRGKTNVLRMGVGYKFKLEHAPSKVEELLVIRSTHHFPAVLPGSTPSSGGTDFYNAEIRTIPGGQQYRSPLVTPKPVISGPQSAIVVGDDEAARSATNRVFTDEYGRVKVKFHWDHDTGTTLRPDDDNASCWVRVTQIFAGDDRGAMIIPHIGEEVIISFLEGDPDRPIVTGRVFNVNATDKPAFDNPATPTYTTTDGGALGADVADINFLAPTQNKIHLKDHYGNQVVMDSTTGNEMVMLYSPKYESSISVGEGGVCTETKSTQWDITGTNSHEMTIGTAEELFLGAKFEQVIGTGVEVFVGTQLGFWGGVGLEINLGFKYSLEAVGCYEINLADKLALTWAVEREWNLAESIKKANDEIVYDSENYILLVGGKEDNSLLALKDEHVKLSYGKGSENHSNNIAVPVMLGVSGIIAAITGAIGLVSGPLGGMSESPKVEDPGWKAALKAASGVVGAVPLTGIGIAAIINIVAKFVSAKKRVYDGELQDTNLYSQLLLREKGFDLFCNEGGAADGPYAGYIGVPTGKVGLNILAEKFIKMASTSERVSITGSEVKLEGSRLVLQGGCHINNNLEVK